MPMRSSLETLGQMVEVKNLHKPKHGESVGDEGKDLDWDDDTLRSQNITMLTLPSQRKLDYQLTRLKAMCKRLTTGWPTKIRT